MTDVQHVPAWKRLGLKLKNAISETSVTSTASDQNNDNYRHEKRKRKDTDSDRSNKRSKSFDLKNYASPQTNGYGGAESQPSATDRFINSVYGNQSRVQSTKTPQKIKFDEEGERYVRYREHSLDKCKQISSISISRLTGTSTPAQESVNGDLGHSLARKKSVTFTPETKLEDGESGQAFAKAWLAPRNGNVVTQSDEPEISTPTKLARTSETEDKSAASNVSQTKLLKLPEEKQKKPPKKPKPTKKERKLKKAETAERQSAKAQTTWSEYLLQYSQDKSHWKFSKGTQNALFRHIWDLESLPSTLTEALGTYIAGLQGQNIRTKLADEAVEHLRALLEKYKDQLEISEVEHLDIRHSQDLCKRALKIECDDLTSADDAEAGVKENMKNTRAYVIFYDNKLSNNSTAEAKLPEPPIDHEARKAPISKRQARKSRTAAADSSSSSDSSLSDSESETDSDSSHSDSE